MTTSAFRHILYPLAAALALLLTGCIGAATPHEAPVHHITARGQDRINALDAATDSAGRQCSQQQRRLQVRTTDVAPPGHRARQDLATIETLPPTLGEIAAGSQEGEAWRVELGYQCL
ncbi:hypothetical protein C7446_2673 [Kushneria sinocarnis]|uniref:Lipoprotein n=1 Tax=Kushneria sinocarnis TaxID=595502 RepID=A0A420WUZ3_9GAMM|nr:hypothetical protein [Kushneria sinocarnis]RKQ97250.1 hypothetical protein C7446_2673 [Kushneria sinocarnis]